MNLKPSLRYVLAVDADHNEQVLTLEGKLVGSPEAVDMLTETRERVREGLINIVMEMSEVRLINSNGVGILASMITSVRRRDGKLILVGLNERSRKVLEFMNLQEYAVLCDNLQEAREAEA